MPDDRALRVASALVEGSSIDWREAELQAVDERERSVVHELRILSDIADLAKNPSSRRTDWSERADAEVETVDPETWGHLQIRERIGQGSFGTVYKAFDTRLERHVALKLIRPSRVSSQFDLARTLKEARLLARVRHPGVVNVLGADYHDARFGLWMELVTGRTLHEHLALNGTMSGQEAAALGVDLCHALAAVHGAGLLHRDVKATNVMREDGGRIVLMDFGAGRAMPSADDEAYALAGTPEYLAPELLSGGMPSAASDVYSIGVLLFHMVSADYPFRRSLRRPEAQPSPRVLLRDLRPTLPSAFIDVVDRALDPDPNQRYRSAGEFGAALASVAGVRDERHAPRRIPWRAAAIVVAALALVAGSLYFARRPPGEMVSSRAAEVAAPSAVAPSTYQVGASLFAIRDGQEIRLPPGSRVQPGDRLFLTLAASQPVFVYVVNQDESGQTFLLFPLAGYQPGNPVPAGATSRLPGSRRGEPHYWQVTSVGGQEHFLVYVTPERLGAFEQILAALPRAELGRPVDGIPLSVAAIEGLRGVGGIVGGGAATDKLSALAELEPLPEGEEQTTGVWARRITLENPAK